MITRRVAPVSAGVSLTFKAWESMIFRLCTPLSGQTGVDDYRATPTGDTSRDVYPEGGGLRIARTGQGQRCTPTREPTEWPL